MSGSADLLQAVFSDGFVFFRDWTALCPDTLCLAILSMIVDNSVDLTRQGQDRKLP